MPTFFQGTWSAVKKLNEDTFYYSVRLKTGANLPNLSFKPGQFVQIFRDASKSAHSRAYSITSVPTSLPNLEFCIKHYPGGILSEYLQTVKVGQPVLLKGPFGKFHLLSQEHLAPSVFVVTGTGIAPVRSMVQTLFEMEPQSNVTLIQGHRTASGIFFRKEFEQLAAKNPHFTYLPTVSLPHQERTGAKRGYVTDVLRTLKLVPQTVFYLCGNPAMVREATAHLLTQKIPAEQIVTEKW